MGIKVLKDKLSSYLKLVRQGEVIMVTDRDEVIAEIRRPIKRALYAEHSIANLLVELNAQGKLRLADEGLILSQLNELPPKIEKISLKKIIDEIRSDRN